jgi:hypothetical protein
MYLRSVIVAAIFALAARAVAGDTPDVSLPVPKRFATEVTVEHYRTGQDLLHDATYHLITTAPLTEYHGWFGPRAADQAHIHGWKVDVFARYSPKVADGIATAKDGYQADLNIEPEFFGVDERSYMFARFKRKHFRWGDAVSFFSQFTQDTGIYVPHNGHLTYEIWGVTRDHKYTVVASVGVRHPKLANWGPDVRDARSLQALKRDRDYKLVERCAPDEFEPALTGFDQMLDTLVIR